MRSIVHPGVLVEHAQAQQGARQHELAASKANQEAALMNERLVAASNEAERLRAEVAELQVRGQNREPLASSGDLRTY